jgi:hypothetical protein
MAFLWPIVTVVGAALTAVGGLNWYVNTQGKNIVNAGRAVKCAKHHHPLSGLEARDTINQHREDRLSAESAVLEGFSQEAMKGSLKLANKLATDLFTKTLPANKADNKRLQLASEMRRLRVRCPACQHYCGWTVA